MKRSLCSLTVLTRGVHHAFGDCIFIYALVFPYIFFYLPVSLNDNIELKILLWQWWLGGPSAFESQWQHWTVKRSLCALTVLTRGVHMPLVSVSLYMHWYFLIFSSICLLVSMTTLNGEEITMCSDSGDWGLSICLWVSMTTLNSEEITLCSDSVDLGGPSAFGVCMFIYALVFPYIFFYLPVSLNDNIECLCTLYALTLVIFWGIFFICLLSLIWQHWIVKRSLCALTVLTRGVHMPLVSVSLYMHWYFLIFSSICLLVSMTTFNSEEITLFSDSGDWGDLYICHLPLPVSLNDNIEQWRDHSVLWQCWLGGIHMPLVSVSLYMHWYFLIFSSICLLVSMTTFNSEEITLCSDSVDLGGWQSYAFGVCIFIYALVFPYIFFYLPVSLNDII